MNHYDWKVHAVSSASDDAVQPIRVRDVARSMEHALNSLEEGGFEVYDVMRAPVSRDDGFLVVGRKPKRFPSAPKSARPFKPQR